MKKVEGQSVYGVDYLLFIMSALFLTKLALRVFWHIDGRFPHHLRVTRGGVPWHTTMQGRKKPTGIREDSSGWECNYRRRHEQKNKCSTEGLQKPETYAFAEL